jgi:hypothetical protein
MGGNAHKWKPCHWDIERYLVCLLAVDDGLDDGAIDDGLHDIDMRLLLLHPRPDNRLVHLLLRWETSISEIVERARQREKTTNQCDASLISGTGGVKAIGQQETAQGSNIL